MKKISKKYLNLKKIEEVVPVPELMCLTFEDVCKIIKNLDEIEKEIKIILNDISLTKGTFLNNHIKAIGNIINQCQWDDCSDVYLEEILKRLNVTDINSQFYAVRSASTLEDSINNSFAGIYQSELNVKGINAIKKAIKKVYFSAYSRSAIVEKLNNGLLGSEMSINVIIQKMVDSKIAGVAFSYDPVEKKDQIVIEYNTGLGDQIVSGEREVIMLVADYGGNIVNGKLNEEFEPIVYKIVQNINTISNLFNTYVDVEWAWDGEKLWILQVRPITAVQEKNNSYCNESVWEIADLYGDVPLESKYIKISDYAQYFRTKRKPLFDIAKECGFSVGRAKMVNMNRLGLSFKDNCDNLLNNFEKKNVVIDFSDNLRQIIVGKYALIKELNRLISGSTRVYNVVLRDYIYGEKGFISTLVCDKNSEKVIIEYSDEGLMAINRGTANTKIIEIYLDKDNDVFDRKNTNGIIEFMNKVSEIGTSIQVEWVIEGSCLYPVDYTLLGNDAMLANSFDINRTSNGYAIGRVIKLVTNEKLLQMSLAPVVSMDEIPDINNMGESFEDIWEKIKKQEPPLIIAVEKPYASLASLIPYVNGFIFESSSMLCHLSILLRENKIPAIAVKDIFNTLETGMFVEINTEAEQIFKVVS